MVGGGAAKASLVLLLLATPTIGSLSSAAQASEQISTTIIKCYYPGFSTGNPTSAVTRVESTGPILPPIFLYTPCVEAFNTLSMAGFKLVHSFAGTNEAGVNDGSDFTVWRTRYEISPGSRVR